MSARLTGTQATDAHEIAQQEVRRFAHLLSSEIATVPMRADGNVNAKDLWEGLHSAIKRYDEGEAS